MSGHGGAREGSGRKKIHENVKNYSKALSLIDDNIITAIETLIEIMKTGSNREKFQAASKLIDKVVPDQKNIELPEDIKIEVEFK